MPDIMIYRGRRNSHRYFFAESDQGVKWLCANMAYSQVGGDYYVAVEYSHIEELITFIESAELTVEECRDSKSVL